jgi:ribosomal protein S18 acetylase RimI-like enzyme
MNYSMRPATVEDGEFLYRLYASTREDIASLGWNATQREPFLRMQFNAQQRWYETTYPQAEHQMIESGGAPIGRIIVSFAEVANLLVDISMLPEFRSAGIGTELIQKLIRASREQGKSVRLQVLKTNRAQTLYLRLGFAIVAQDQLYLQMQTSKN